MVPFFMCVPVMTPGRTWFGLEMSHEEAPNAPAGRATAAVATTARAVRGSFTVISLQGLTALA
jgi:hypothetical protein